MAALVEALFHELDEGVGVQLFDVDALRLGRHAAAHVLGEIEVRRVVVEGRALGAAVELHAQAIEVLRADGEQEALRVEEALALSPQSFDDNFANAVSGDIVLDLVGDFDLAVDANAENQRVESFVVDARDHGSLQPVPFTFLPSADLGPDDADILARADALPAGTGVFLASDYKPPPRHLFDGSGFIAKQYLGVHRSMPLYGEIAPCPKTTPKVLYIRRGPAYSDLGAEAQFKISLRSRSARTTSCFGGLAVHIDRVGPLVSGADVCQDESRRSVS